MDSLCLVSEKHPYLVLVRRRSRREKDGRMIVLLFLPSAAVRPVVEKWSGVIVVNLPTCCGCFKTCWARRQFGANQSRHVSGTKFIGRGGRMSKSLRARLASEEVLCAVLQHGARPARGRHGSAKCTRCGVWKSLSSTTSCLSEGLGDFIRVHRLLLN